MFVVYLFIFLEAALGVAYLFAAIQYANHNGHPNAQTKLSGTRTQYWNRQNAVRTNLNIFGLKDEEGVSMDGRDIYVIPMRDFGYAEDGYAGS